MSVLDKHEPASIQAEQIVLGSLLIDNLQLPVAIELLGLQGDAFFDERHRAIYRAIMAVSDEREAADPLAVANELERLSKLAFVGGFPYLSSIESMVLSPGNMKAHCRVVLERWLGRRLAETGRALTEKAGDDANRPKDVVGWLESEVFRISQGLKLDRPEPRIELITRSVLDDIDARANGTVPDTGVATGYRDLDHMTGGLQRSDLIILAARPGCGKTALALNIAANVAGVGPYGNGSRVPRRVGFVSCEMGGKQIVQRWLSGMSQIALSDVRLKRLGLAMRERLSVYGGRLANSPILIEDAPGLAIAELRAKIRRWHVQHPDLALIVVDQLSFIRAPSNGKSHDGRRGEIMEITRALKELAREIDRPILLLCQLRRSPPGKKDKRPGLDELKESGSIEEDADLVLFIYHEDSADPLAPSWLLLEKQRNGPTGDIPIHFQRSLTLFADAAKPERRPPPTGHGLGPDGWPE